MNLPRCGYSVVLGCRGYASGSLRCFGYPVLLSLYLLVGLINVELNQRPLTHPSGAPPQRWVSVPCFQMSWWKASEAAPSHVSGIFSDQGLISKVHLRLPKQMLRNPFLLLTQSQIFAKGFWGLGQGSVICRLK